MASLGIEKSILKETSSRDRMMVEKVTRDFEVLTNKHNKMILLYQSNEIDIAGVKEIKRLASKPLI
jgi:hypothetical protein